MKYKFYCGVDENASVKEFLETRKIKYETDTFLKRIYFTIYSDTENSDELLGYITSLPETSISKSSVFSEQEMEKANWYLLDVTRMGIDTSNTDYTYDSKCPYTTCFGMKKHRHLDQIGPFVSKRTPKWKKGYQFCSVETGFTTRIFCSDAAKRTIRSNGIAGIEFINVLKGDLKTPTSDVSQLVFKNKLSREDYTFIGDFRENVCPFCGRINYVFTEPNCDNIRLNTSALPEGIDAFGSHITIGEGFGDEPIVISKKFYDLLIKEMKENPKHFIFYPIG